MTQQIRLGDTIAEVEFKNIRNIHLSVYPPNGRVRIAAPLRMNLDTIRVYAVSQLDWIRRQQKKLAAQERETPREYLNRESHYVWGKRYLLKVVEVEAAPSVELKHRKMVLRVRPDATEETKQAVLARWYRDQLREALPALLAQWEPLLGVKVNRVFVQKMKTRWGSCNPAGHAIRLNTDLAKKPPQCLEYVLVHELAHLVEHRHNDRFKAMMDGLLPGWRQLRDELNRMPLAHEDWLY
ncbi:MAG: metal-dependent hydrolase [Deltaproteobacteria bacterium HGW-Deltaproteobacteria-22]|jgi:hypothetical protein|nr:MAG: metal-dependent hydrolase [Deltaproteobacteria bacterium HGW-Deltaproteobacteria-22]